MGAVHCIAGKGRTGTMCAAWLLYSGICETSTEALGAFANKRFEGGQWTSPLRGTQRYYLQYLEAALQARKQEKGELQLPQKIPKPTEDNMVNITKIVVEFAPLLTKKKATAFFAFSQDFHTIVGNQHKLESFGEYETVSPDPKNTSRKTRRWQFTLLQRLGGDIKLAFYEDPSDKHALFYLCFNTHFLQISTTEGCTFSKGDIDPASRDVEEKIYHRDFAVVLFGTSGSNTPSVSASPTASKWRAVQMKVGVQSPTAASNLSEANDFYSVVKMAKAMSSSSGQ